MPEAPVPPRTALFISHATPEDNHFVRWLGAKLTAMGYEVWADVMRLHGGIDWARELENALRKRAVKVLLVCTPSGLEKQGVRNEIEMATNLARQLGDNAFIIPLRLEAYEAPFRIAHAQYIDFKRSWAAGLAELTELLRDQAVPRGSTGPLESWLDSHSDGADRLIQRGEPLVSNWLQIEGQPGTIRYVESRVGASLERFQNRVLHDWPTSWRRWTQRGLSSSRSRLRSLRRNQEARRWRRAWHVQAVVRLAQSVSAASSARPRRGSMDCRTTLMTSTRC